VQSYVRENRKVVKGGTPATIFPLPVASLISPLPVTRLACAPFAADEKTPEFPKPKSGAMYSPAEVVSILNSIGNGTTAAKKQQTAVKKVMIEKHLVGPKTMGGFNLFLAKVAKSGGTAMPSFWNNKGVEKNGNSSWVLCNPDDLEGYGTRGLGSAEYEWIPR